MNWIAKATYREMGEMCGYPKGHGVAYVDYMSDVTVTAIIPLNWVIGWAHSFWWQICRGPKPTMLQKKFYQDACRDMEMMMETPREYMERMSKDHPDLMKCLMTGDMTESQERDLVKAIEDMPWPKRNRVITKRIG